MKTGLRKRETYNELIHDLEQDPIKHYPNRKATEIENSNYMSQLGGDFDEMLHQNERILKEKQKANLLQQMAAGSGSSHHHMQIAQTSNYWSPPTHANMSQPFWQDGMSQSSIAFLSDDSRNHRIHPAVESDLAQAEFNNLMHPPNDRPLLGQLFSSTEEEHQLTISSSSLHPHQHTGPQLFSIADDTAESDALIADLERIMEESGRIETTVTNRQRAIEGFRVSGQMAQVTQADEILAQGIVQPAIIAIEDRVRTARSSHSGAASSSSATAPRRQVTISSAAVRAGPEDLHEPKGKPGRPRSSSAAVRVLTEPEEAHEARSSRTRTQSRVPRQAQPVGERIDITTEPQQFKKKKDWDKYDVKELRTQLKLRKSKDYKAAAVNKMDKEDIIEILMIMDVGKTGL